MLALALVGAGLLSAGPAAADTQPPPGTPATVSSDGLPTWQVNGVVWAQAIAGNTVYVAGSFTKARPPGTAEGDVGEVDAQNAFAYDITTGNRVTSFHPAFDAQTKSVAVSPDGKTVYFGGDFSSVKTAATAATAVGMGHLAAFDTTTNLLVPGFDPQVGATVLSIAVGPTAVYIGGAFSKVSGVSRPWVAAVSPLTGALDPSWAPVLAEPTAPSNQEDASVLALVITPDGSEVVMGGRFSSVNGDTTVYGMGAVDIATGTVNKPWAANQSIVDFGTSGAITSLRTDGTSIYGTAYKFGGTGPANGPHNFEGTFVADPATGALLRVNDCHGDSYDVLPVGSVMYVASHAHSCAAIGAFKDSLPDRINRFALAYANIGSCTNIGPDDYGWNFDGLPCSQVLAWYPTLTPGTYTGQNQAGWSLAGNASYVSFGGEFTAVNGVAQQGLVRFATAGTQGNPNRTGPVFSSVVAPTAYASGPGEVTVSWPSAYDRDNAELTYQLQRSTDSSPTLVDVGTPTKQSSTFWQRPTLAAADSGLDVGRTVQYRVRVTDPYGNQVTSGFSVPVVVSAASISTFARDTFQREVALGAWGSAETGGQWVGPMTSNFGVSGGKGVLLMPPGSSTQLVNLDKMSVPGADVAVTLTSTTPPGSGAFAAYVVGRRVSSSTDYRAVVRLLSTTEVSLALVATVSGKATTLVPETLVSGLAWSPSSPVRVRLQVGGQGTTTVRAKAWSASSAEPSTWDVATTDSTPALQTSGGIGLGGALSSGTVASDVLANLTFDELLVTTVRVPVTRDQLVPGADLSFGDLSGMDLNGLDLTGVNLTGADLTNASLVGTKLTNATLTSAIGKGANLSNAILTGAAVGSLNLTGATLAGARSGGLKGTPATLPTGWLLVAGYLVGPGANLTGAALGGANLTGADLTGAQVGGIVLAGANLTGAHLVGLDLRGVDLTNSNLTAATLSGVDLTGATLTAVIVSGTVWIDVTCPDSTPSSLHSGGGSCLAPGDVTPPTAALTAPTSLFQTSVRVAVAWRGSDPGGSGPASYDVRVAHQRVTGGAMSSWSMWRAGTSSTSTTLLGTAGYRYCLSVRAHDHAGNVGSWSTTQCTNLPVDDRAMAASRGWVRRSATGWVGSTKSSTSTFKASLTSVRASVRQVGIIATTCRTCGAVAVYVGSTKVGTISLYSRTTVARRLLVLKRFSYVRSGAVRFVVTTSRRAVIVDALVTSAY